MLKWIERIQDQVDSVEDPSCCTKPEPFYCAECKTVLHLIYEELFMADNYFCSEECMDKWLEKNWEE